jgi:hypothetical protein
MMVRLFFISESQIGFHGKVHMQHAAKSRLKLNLILVAALTF